MNTNGTSRAAHAFERFCDTLGAPSGDLGVLVALGTLCGEEGAARDVVAEAPAWLHALGVGPGEGSVLLLLGAGVARRPAPFLAAAIARVLLRTVIAGIDRHDDHLAALVHGWQLGRRAPASPLAVGPADVDEAARLAGLASRPAEDEGIGRGGGAFMEHLRSLVLEPYGAAFASSGALRDATMTEQRRGLFIRTALAAADVQARLSAMPKLGTLDFHELQELAPGTLGRGYADHMLANGLTKLEGMADDDVDLGRYVTGHLVETHDLWHVVTGTGTDREGEISLHSVYNGQLHPLPVTLAFLARCLLKTALFDGEHTGRHLEAIGRGWLTGRRAASLLFIDWKARFGEPLAELRRELAIPVGGVAGVTVPSPLTA